jgi:hypothetical protein
MQSKVDFFAGTLDLKKTGGGTWTLSFEKKSTFLGAKFPYGLAVTES